METKVEEKKQLRVVNNDHMQMMPIAEAQAWYDDFVNFSKSIMKKDLDYGVIPGTPKPSLLKAGAEKLRFVYGLGVEFECIEKTVDLNLPFIDYTYRATIKSKSGQILSQCEGSCNSMEPKFGFLWKAIHELPEGFDISKVQSKTTGKKLSEFDFAINKGETTGQYGKPAEYWDKFAKAIHAGTARKIKKKASGNREFDAWELDESVTVYRINNPDVIGMKNTIMKMAQKRAFVGGVLLATGASEFFTQDIEDMVINGSIATEESDFKNDHISEAEVISETMNTSSPAAQKTHTATPVEDSKNSIPGHWYAKLEKCKTKEDVDALAIKHKDTVQAQPDLRKLFVETKNKLPNAA